jgi:hypothetical protein
LFFSRSRDEKHETSHQYASFESGNSSLSTLLGYYVDSLLRTSPQRSLKREAGRKEEGAVMSEEMWGIVVVGGKANHQNAIVFKQSLICPASAEVILFIIMIL